jgi:hypothetical protein
MEGGSMTTQASPGTAPTAPTSGGPVAGSGGSQGQDDAPVTRSELNRLLDIERKRLSGKEKYYTARIAELEQLLESERKGRSSGSQAPAVTLPDLDPDDPVTPHIQHISDALRAILDKEKAERDRRTRDDGIEAAIAEAVDLGVPVDAITDFSSPDAVRAQAQRWVQDHEKQALINQINELKSQLEGKDIAVRAELGASTPMTVTGSAPAPAFRTIDDQIAAVERELSEFKRAQNGPMIWRANIVLNQLRDMKKQGRQEPVDRV